MQEEGNGDFQQKNLICCSCDDNDVEMVRWSLDREPSPGEELTCGSTTRMYPFSNVLDQ